MTYPDVYRVTFEANTVVLNLGGGASGSIVQLDMDEANTLIDQLIQATRGALNRGTNEALKERSIKDQIRVSDFDKA